jgi:hypothetical protein
MDETERIVIRPSSAKLWTGILLGPIAWLADVQLCLSLQRYVCWNDQKWILWAITAVMAAVCVFAWFQAVRGRTVLQTRRARFMGMAGMFISASMFLGILSTAIFLVGYGPCD